jgi:aldehyde:ferredoxin oxidoreductase
MSGASSSMWNTLLRIDLSARRARTEPVAEELAAWLGGMGYGVKLLADEVPPRTDPLAPENKLVLTVGPLTGTLAPMHPQSCIVTKSPLTDGILNCYAGGFLGAELKFAGLDGIVLEGRAPDWVVLLVEDGQVSFHDAAAVLGKGTAETEAWMRSRFGPEVRTLSIGPAGEKGVAFAGIFSETRTFGRGGAGAVLGSKRLKGLAVRGSRGVGAARPQEFARLVAENMEQLAKACAEEYNLVGMFSRVGTGAGMGLVNGRGGLATRNHEYGQFESFAEIDGFAYARKFYTRAVACYGCPVHCGMLHKFRAADGGQQWLRGPEYETMYSLGSEVGNGDPVTLAEANRLCEEYGMDTLTAGVTVAWALEMGQRGLAREPGLTLRFGDREAILGLLRRIGRREGIGDLLARGPLRAARELGGLEFAMQIKNSGFAAWMPRRMKGTALAFATSNRGACHKRAPIGAEITGQIDMDAYEGKAALVKGIQDRVNAIFTLVSCRFHEFVTPPQLYPRFVEAATGRSLSLSEFERLGERIWNLERLFNLGAGYTRADDALPERCFQPIKGPASEGAVIERAKFEAMLDEYYAARGWDRDGVPTTERLGELGLERYAALGRTGSRG